MVKLCKIDIVILQFEVLKQFSRTEMLKAKLGMDIAQFFLISLQMGFGNTFLHTINLKCSVFTSVGK